MKLLAQDGELYVFAESRDRVAKERSMRRRQLKWLWERLNKLSTMRLTRDCLLMTLGAAQTKTPAAWRLIEVELAEREVPERAPSFTLSLTRYTQPEPELKLLLDKLKLTLPAQAPPKITTTEVARAAAV